MESFSISLSVTGLVSHSMSSGSIRVATCCRMSFFFKIKSCSSVCRNNRSFIHLSFNGRLGCFHILAIVNIAAVNNMQVLFEQLFSVFLGLYVGVELLGHRVTPYLTCWRIINLLFTEAASLYIPFSKAWGFQFLHIIVDSYYFPFLQITILGLPSWSSSIGDMPLISGWGTEIPYAIRPGQQMGKQNKSW